MICQPCVFMYFEIFFSLVVALQCTIAQNSQSGIFSSHILRCMYTCTLQTTVYRSIQRIPILPYSALEYICTLQTRVYRSIPICHIQQPYSAGCIQKPVFLKLLSGKPDLICLHRPLSVSPPMMMMRGKEDKPQNMTTVLKTDVQGMMFQQNILSLQYLSKLTAK